MMAEVMDRLFEEILPISKYALGLRQQGLDEGRQEGLGEGRQEHALKMIRLILAKRFPGVQHAMKPSGKYSLNALDAALESLMLASSEQEARTILAGLASN